MIADKFDNWLPSYLPGIIFVNNSKKDTIFFVNRSEFAIFAMSNNNKE